MSNEELCKWIQEGSHDLLADLWENNKSFVVQQARKMKTSQSVDFEDYCQAGFVALVAAAETYDQSSEANFLSWFRYYLKTAFAETGGWRTKTQLNEPINNAASLDAAFDDDEDGGSLYDVIPSTLAIGVSEDVEEQIYNEQLHEALEAVLANVPDADILRHRYCEEMTQAEVARRMGTQKSDVQTREHRALRAVRRKCHVTKEGAALRRFLDENTNFHYKVGAKQFNRTHTSAVELAAIQRENLERQYERDKRARI